MGVQPNFFFGKMEASVSKFLTQMGAQKVEAKAETAALTPAAGTEPTQNN
jgi:hypothetical protein